MYELTKYLERWDRADEVAGVAHDHPELSDAQVFGILCDTEGLIVGLCQDLRASAARARRAGDRAANRVER